MRSECQPYLPVTSLSNAPLPAMLQDSISAEASVKLQNSITRTLTIIMHSHHLSILMTLDPMSSTIEQVISCNCMGKCETKRCPCKSKQTKCTLLCHKKQKYDHSNCLNWIESYNFIQISSMLQ